jgi:geranylgeranyl diphosphate synthase, type I
MSSATLDTTAADRGDAGVLRPSAAREEIACTLRRALCRLHAPARRVALHHFGWCAQDSTAAPGGPGGPGKMVRGTLAMQVAGAVCGDPSVALAGAVAVELTHNSTLLKDDVMDRDVTRRQRPTAWTIFGESQTMLASDALLTLAFSVLLEHPAESGLAAFQVLAQAYQDLLTGQAMDLLFESCDRVDVDDCIRMADYKTAALLACSARIGAVLSGAQPHQAGALQDFGRHLGLAFQYIDDILGIWGDPAITGKPAGSDIAARKKSLPVTYALSKDEDGPLTGFYTERTAVSPKDVARVTIAIEEAGARTWAADQAAWHAAAAEDSLARAGIPIERQQPLRATARFVTAREY